MRFAARYARRVIVLFDQAWPMAGEHRAALQSAVDLAYRSADEGRACAGLDEAALAACMAAGSAQRPHLVDMPAGPEEVPPVNADASLVATFAAKAAEMAARAALATPGRSSSAAMEAYTFACDALRAAGQPGLHELIEADFVSEGGGRPWWKFW